METTLIPKMKNFADIYLSGKSATQAAIDAGYSERTAGVQAYKMLKRPEVSQYVAAMKAKSTEESGDSAVKWQKELARSAYSNIGDFISLDSEGNPRVDLSNATRDQLAAVQSIKTRKRTIYDAKGNALGEEHNAEIRLWDKLRAMELLGRHAGYLKDTETKIVIDVADRLLSARGRVMQSNELIEYSGDTETETDDDTANR